MSKCQKGGRSEWGFQCEVNALKRTVVTLRFVHNEKLTKGTEFCSIISFLHDLLNTYFLLKGWSGFNLLKPLIKP